jgi:hypothetical protein
MGSIHRWYASVTLYHSRIRAARAECCATTSPHELALFRLLPCDEIGVSQLLGVPCATRVFFSVIDVLAEPPA